MDLFLKQCILHFIFLTFLAHNQAQDIFSAILGGVQNGINLVNNNLDVGQGIYPDYGPPANRDISFFRSNEVSLSNQNQQNDSDEPNNSNSEQRQEGDSNWSSEEYDKENHNAIENNKRFPVNNQKIYNNQQKRVPVNNQKIYNNQQKRFPNRITGPVNFNIRSRPKPEVGKPELPNNKPVPLKERLDSNDSINYNNKSINSHNDTAFLNDNSTNLNDRSTTSIPLIFLVNSTVISDIPNFSAINDTVNEKTTNSTNPITEKNIEKDIKNVLKPLTKKIFLFQAKPVRPINEEESTNETVYYVDLD